MVCFCDGIILDINKIYNLNNFNFCPFQSIYGFNGSNSDLMTVNFVEDFEPQIFELYENFRSAKKIPLA